MGSLPVEQMVNRVAQLLEQRLRLRGSTLAEKAAKGGRVLSRRMKAELKVLAEAEELARNPRLLPMIDLEKVSAAYDHCVVELKSMGRADRMKGVALEIAGSIAFRLLAVFALVIAVLVYRGFL